MTTPGMVRDTLKRYIEITKDQILKTRFKGKTMFVHVKTPDGKDYKLEAPEGWRLMEVIRDYGLPIKAECGGACACATCHVRLLGDWADKVPAPTDEELNMLDEVFDADDNSRLSCQILTSDEIDGIEVELAEDALDEAKMKAAS
jgi:2Fe-2S ferredoxin